MVFQNPGASLNPRRTVGQSIRVPLVAHGFAGDKAARVGNCWRWCSCRRGLPIGIRMSCRAGRSSGWRLRGRWRLSRGCLVLDEPTSALDVSVQAKVIDLLETSGGS
jgi:peptide/nickel transport system ATP-binding protein